jgi:uncharacterized membrane protein
MSVFIFFLVCFILYFFPSIMAIKKNHNNLAGIMILNVFLGWTLVGWVAAMIWSIYRK